MIIFPAIDLRRGKCVRLRQGDFGDETVFGEDPAAIALQWAGEGASWLHVVNLDGALGERADLNLAALSAIVTAVALPVQFGGGVHSLQDIATLLELGVERVILGTVAIKQPEIVEQAIERFGAARIVVGLDARDGRVATHGWLNLSEVRSIDLACQLGERGVERVVYTDIGRDGMMAGVNVEGSVELAQASGVQVIASGGVASLDDIRALLPYQQDGIEGVITGMALYRGTMRLSEAIELAQGEGDAG